MQGWVVAPAGTAQQGEAAPDPVLVEKLDHHGDVILVFDVVHLLRGAVVVVSVDQLVLQQENQIL